MSAKKARPSKKRADLDISVEVPAWVDGIPDRRLRSDLWFAFAHRALAVARGAEDGLRGRSLLRRGDALMARVEKRPSTKAAAKTVCDADDLYSEAQYADLPTWREQLREVRALGREAAERRGRPRRDLLIRASRLIVGICSAGEPRDKVERATFRRAEWKAEMLISGIANDCVGCVAEEKVSDEAESPEEARARKRLRA